MKAMNINTKKSAKKVALYGTLVALAFILSFLESFLPLSIGVPGVKLGLANLVIVVSLLFLQPGEALTVSLVRMLLVSFTFGSPAALLYSLCGGLGSFFVMWGCMRSGKFSLIGVSMAGGVSHNIGQIIAAMFVTRTIQILWYMPVLLVFGLLTGGLLGLAAIGIQKSLCRVQFLKP